MGAVKNGNAIKVTGAGNTLATITADINDVTWIEESPAGTWTIKQKGFLLMNGAEFTMGNAGDFSVAEKLIFNNTASRQCDVYQYENTQWYIYGDCEIHQTQDPVAYYNTWYVYGKFHVEGDATYKPIMEGFYAVNWRQQYEEYENDYNRFENMISQNMRPNGRFYVFSQPRRLAPFGLECVKDSVLYGNGGTSNGLYPGAAGGDDTTKMVWENVIFDGFGTAVSLGARNAYLKNCIFQNNISMSVNLIGAIPIYPGEYEGENLKLGKNMGQYGFTFLEGCTCKDGASSEDIYINDNAWLLIKDCDFSNPVNSVDVRYLGILWVWTGNTHVAAVPYGISSGLVFWVHSLDLTVEDSNGSPIEDALILVKQKDGKEQWSFRTDSNGRPKTAGCLGGKILCIWREQLDSAGNMTYWSDASNSTYHDIWIWAEGYEPAKLTLEMSDERIQTVQLEDALTAPDVRDTIPFGLGLIGELDLPAAVDVEKGVKYDSETKTGTFKAPAEVNVRDGEGYGADDNEFTGELDLPLESDVEKGVKYDSEIKEGTLELPIEDNVRKPIGYGDGGIEFTGKATVPVKADVRKDVDVDVSDKGLLDLPAIGDVEEGVKFDNETKTGNFKVPIEAKVEKDYQYGAEGTEFTGALIGQNIFKADAVGKLQQRVSMKGILKEGG